MEFSTFLTYFFSVKQLIDFRLFELLRSMLYRTRTIDLYYLCRMVSATWNQCERIQLSQMDVMRSSEYCLKIDELFCLIRSPVSIL